MMVLSAGGWRAAICRPLKPPQEMPIIATCPSHQSCAASQAMASQPSSCSCTVYSSSIRPSLSPVPRMSRRIAGIAVAGEIMVQALVARPRAVTLAIGKIFENGRHGPGALREPAAGGKPGAVGQRNEEVLHHPDGKGKSDRTATIDDLCCCTYV